MEDSPLANFAFTAPFFIMHVFLLFESLSRLTATCGRRTWMKKLTLPGWILLLGWAANLDGATYYLAENGRDANAGTSAQTAWQTVDKLNQTSSIRSGDSIRFRRGDIFRGEVNKRSGIVYSDYGEAASPRPVLSGAEAVTDWSQWSGEIYAASISFAPDQVYVDGQHCRLARYPNEGWLKTDAGTANNGSILVKVVDAALRDHPRRAVNYWEGANVRIRRWSWWFETRPVSADDGQGSLDLSSAGGHGNAPQTPVGWGYYLDNKLSELDAPGEWFYDADSNQLYLWAPGGGDPGNYEVEATRWPIGMQTSGGSVENLTFRHFTQTGLNIDGGTAVRGCVFEQIGDTGLSGGWGLNGAVISDNIFRDILNVGISINQNPGALKAVAIERNQLTRIGMVPGYGGGGSWHAAGMVIINGPGITVRENRIEETGYAGIIVGSPDTLVERNLIRRAMSTLNDGGGVYTNTSRTLILDNLILDTVGNLESSGPWSNLGFGIFLEFLGYRDSTVEGNVIARSGAPGLFFQNHPGTLVRHNVFYGNPTGIALDAPSRSGYENGYDDTIEGNLLVTLDRRQAALRFDPGYDYGRLAGNFFAPAPGLLPIAGGTASPNITVGEWQRLHEPHDATPGWPAAGVKLAASWEHGPNLLPNGDFTAGIGGWVLDADSSASLEWERTRADMAGSSLHIRKTGAYFLLAADAPLALEDGRYYQVRCRVASSVATQLRLVIESAASGQDTAAWDLAVDQSPRDFEFSFQCHLNADDGRLLFYRSSAESLDYWIDDVSLRSAGGGESYVVEEEMRLFVNDSWVDQRVDLEGRLYRDFGGEPVSGTLSLPYLSGRVLFRQHPVQIRTAPAIVNWRGVALAIGVTAGPDVAWQAVSRSDWIVLFNGSDFRGDDTITAIVSANDSEEPRSGTLDIDGTELIIEQAGRSSAVSIFTPPGSVALGNGWKWNGLGFLWDELYPFVYLASVNGRWLYLDPGAVSEAGFFLYDFQRHRWGWTSQTAYPWYYQLGDPEAGQPVRLDSDVQ